MYEERPRLRGAGRGRIPLVDAILRRWGTTREEGHGAAAAHRHSYLRVDFKEDGGAEAATVVLLKDAEGAAAALTA